ncbi:hypothetical protein IM700_012215 [Paenibacillus sp. DXFW5]|uniref:Uncharacterized protein n=1 Tax=Paenibacillus rhizolycopersici TaxID=2780073 RepID=A0ABS2H4L2_9BACL|nr:hypothetical protein [Paenibacillus sp. J53TS2]MBM6996412.1 hypothetical protein [Paenibacillus rhizolycopersici]GIP48867.1 hypothetical protein J53TS2_24580 [Paenibacillus sp. J53TS2]
MKRWLFVGKSDKRDLLLYLCSVLATAGSKVLLRDGTENGKYRYSIGGDSSLPIMEFYGFDVATGGTGFSSPLTNMSDEVKTSAYDYELHDVDKLNGLTPELFTSADEIVWVTTYERYEVEASRQWFRSLFDLWPQLRGLAVRPVFIRTIDSSVNSRFILSLLDGLPLEWRSAELCIPWNESNLAAQLENEHTQRLRLGSLSRSYKRALRELLSELACWDHAIVKRAVRQAERGQA